MRCRGRHRSGRCIAIAVRPLAFALEIPASERRLLRRALGKRRLQGSADAIGDIDPAAAERLVDIDQFQCSVGLCAHGVQLGGEQLVLRIEHFDVAGIAVVEAPARQPRVLPECRRTRGSARGLLPPSSPCQRARRWFRGTRSGSSAGTRRAPRAWLASAVRTWPAIAPAVKIGPDNPAARDHAVAGPLRKFAERRADRSQRPRQRDADSRAPSRRRYWRWPRRASARPAGCRAAARADADGRSAGMPGSASCADRLAARKRAGIAAEQKRDQVLLRGDLLLQRPEWRPAPADIANRPARPRASRRRRPCGAARRCARSAHSSARSAARSRAGDRARAGDIARGDARDQRQHDAAPALLARVDARLRRFGLAPYAAEEVDLPVAPSAPW